MGEAKRRKATALRLRALTAPIALRPITKLAVPAGASLPQRDLALHAITINPEVDLLPRQLHDKHFFRKHGATAYYGQAKKMEK